MPSGPPPALALLLLASLAQALAAGSGVAVARRRPSHAPVAWFLVLVTLANLALLGFILAGSPVQLPAAPYEGTARVAHHLRQALFFSWTFGFIWMAVAVFLEKRIGRWVFLAYLLTLAAFVGGYPTLGGAILQRAYLVVELAGLVVGLGTLIQFAWRRESLSLSHLAVILLLFAEFAVLLGAWTKDVFSGGWEAARVMYLVTYLVVAVIQGVAVWKRST